MVSRKITGPKHIKEVERVTIPLWEKKGFVVVSRKGFLLTLKVFHDQSSGFSKLIWLN